MSCTGCKYRSNVPGSAHSSCTVLDGYEHSNLLKLGVLAGKYEITVKINGEAQPAVDFDEYGKKMGWANWPYDFDPRWLKKCVFRIDKEELKDNNNN